MTTMEEQSAFRTGSFPRPETGHVADIVLFWEKKSEPVGISVTANSGIMSSRDNGCHPGMTEISMLFWDDNGGRAHVIHGLSKS